MRFMQKKKKIVTKRCFADAELAGVRVRVIGFGETHDVSLFLGSGGLSSVLREGYRFAMRGLRGKRAYKERPCTRLGDTFSDKGLK